MKSEHETDTDPSPSSNTERCRICQSFMSYFQRFPRISALLVGAVIPLWSLVVSSLLFGYFLSCAEAPYEIHRNDKILQVVASYTSNTTQITMSGMELKQSLPIVCWNLFTSGVSEKNATELKHFITDQFIQHGINASYYNNSMARNVVEVNETKFLQFSMECFATGTQIADELQLSKNFSVPSNTALTFSWIICMPDYNRFLEPSLPRSSNEYRRPEVQKDQFVSNWKKDQIRLYELFFDQYYNGSNEMEARQLAFNQSIAHATGKSSCRCNVAGSAWFWFTVMTTIGYGNQMVVSVIGRMMIYTVGFLSILAFATVLSISSYVVSAIMDDILARYRLVRLTKPVPACLLWCSTYVLWMLLIGKMTRKWKQYRLSIDMTQGDSLWFAYLSTTTIGLGDIYLEPEVFNGFDLFYFPILFLIGFVLLGVFLEKFANFMNLTFRGGKQKPIVTSILSRLATTSVLLEGRQSTEDQLTSAESRDSYGNSNQNCASVQG